MISLKSPGKKENNLSYITTGIKTFLASSLFIRTPHSNKEFPPLYETIKEINLPPLSESAQFYSFQTSLLNFQQQITDYPELSDFATEIEKLAYDAGQPLLLMVIGHFKTGKSTFLNALLGDEILKCDVTPATAAVTLIKYGMTPQLNLHYRNGKKKKMSFELLKTLSSEGSLEGEKFRKELYYIEVTIPNPLLENLILIDTPGLNSNNPLHTEATKNFISRADAVIWLFSYSQAATATELSDIKSLPQDCKPLAVVNQIDQIDLEEETIEEVLGRIERRLSQTVHKPVGISAKLALEGKLNGDEELLKESKWNEFLDLFQEEIIYQSKEKKINQLISRLSIILEKINEKIEPLQIELRKAQENLNHGANYENSLKENIRNLTRDKNEWLSSLSIDPLNVILKASFLNDSIENSSKLNRKLDLLKSSTEELADRESRLNIRLQKHNQECIDYEKRVRDHKADVADYNTSGLFGGPPIFWGIFDGGRGDRIRQTESGLNKEAAEGNARSVQLNSDLNAHKSRLGRAKEENRQFVNEICTAITKTTEKLKKEIKNKKQVEEAARQKIIDSYWAIEAGYLLENTTIPKLKTSVELILKNENSDSSSKNVSEIMKKIFVKPSILTADIKKQIQNTYDKSHNKHKIDKTKKYKHVFTFLLSLFCIFLFLGATLYLKDTNFLKYKFIKNIKSYLMENIGRRNKYLKNNSIKPDIVYIKGGTFKMGSNNGDGDEKPVHSATVRSFYIGKYEVTNKEYCVYDSNHYNPGNDLPVVNITRDDAVNYCKWLNKKTGKNYRLPTEAEWEYACRAGTNTEYYRGDKMDGDYYWYHDNSKRKVHPVGQKKPNPFGLYDMSGNVWEWCSDWYGTYPSGSISNPTGPRDGLYGVSRGGSWFSNTIYCRSACRYKVSSISPDDNLGFRLVMEEALPSQSSAKPTFSMPNYIEHGEIALKDKRYEEANKWFKEAINLNLSQEEKANLLNLKLYCNLKIGEMYLRKKSYDTGMKNYKEALHIDMDNNEAKKGLARCFMGKGKDLLSDGKYKEARGYFSKKEIKSVESLYKEAQSKIADIDRILNSPTPIPTEEPVYVPIEEPPQSVPTATYDSPTPVIF